MGVIYFSYGMTKSASTFVYQLECKIFELSSYNLVKAPSEIRGNKAAENYMEPITDKKVQELAAWLPDGAATVIKTHGPPSPLAIDLINSGAAFASATYRDPRDIAISLVDHGKKSREKGISDFSDFEKPMDALDELKRQLNRLNPWLELSGCLSLSYETIRQDSEIVADKVINQLGLSGVNTADVLDPFQDKKEITHFNVGASERYKKHMSQEELEVFNSELGEFIEFAKPQS